MIMSGLFPSARYSCAGVNIILLYAFCAYLVTSSRAHGECHTADDTLQQSFSAIIRQILKQQTDQKLVCSLMCKSLDTSGEDCSGDNKTTLDGLSVQNMTLLFRNYIEALCNCSRNSMDKNDLLIYNELVFPFLCSMVEMFPTNYLEMFSAISMDTTSANNLDVPLFPLYITATLIALVGVIGNVITICVLVCKPSLRTPTYRMLVHLAVGDIFSILIVFVSYFTSLSLVIMFCFDEKYLLPLLYLFVGICLHNSSVQVVLLSILRYFLIVHPLRCRKDLTCKKVSFASYVGSLISLVIAGAVLIPLGREFLFGNFLTLSKNIMSSSSDISFSFLFFDIYLTIVPTALLLIFHLLKIRQVSKSKSCSQSTNNMYAAVTVIIVIHMIPTASDLTFSAASLALGYEWYQENTLIVYCVKIVWLVRLSSNPFIYFFLSPPGKKFCSGIAKVGSCLRRRP